MLSLPSVHQWRKPFFSYLWVELVLSWTRSSCTVVSLCIRGATKTHWRSVGNNHIYISSSRKLTREAQGGKAEEGIKTPMLLFTAVTNTSHCSALHQRKESRYKASPLTTIPRPPDIPQRNQPSAQKQHLANCEATKIRGFEASHGQLKGVLKGIGVAIGKGDLLTPSVNFAIKEDLRAEMWKGIGAHKDLNLNLDSRWAEVAEGKRFFPAGNLVQQPNLV